MKVLSKLLLKYTVYAVYMKMISYVLFEVGVITEGIQVCLYGGVTEMVLLLNKRDFA